MSPETEDKHVSGVPHVSAIGSMMYVMVYTCLDISLIVSVVSKFKKILVKFTGMTRNESSIILEILHMLA